MTNRSLYKVAGIAAVLSLVTGVMGFLHPRPDPDVELSLYSEIEKAGDWWLLIHVITISYHVLGLIVMLALYRAISASGAGTTFALLGAVFAVMATSVAFVWTAIDGVALEVVARDFYATPEADRELLVPAAKLGEEIILALWSTTHLLWFGVAVALLGAAVVASDPQRSALGWVGVAAGVFASVAALIQLYESRTVLTAQILFPISSLWSGVWLVVIGVLLWRRSWPEAPVAAPVAPAVPPR